MHATAATIDGTRCPLCGTRNGCAMEAARETGAPQPPCWCMAADFGRAPLSRLPPELRGKACLCARCAAGLPAAAPAQD
jgi:hypothetical protein